MTRQLAALYSTRGVGLDEGISMLALLLTAASLSGTIQQSGGEIAAVSVTNTTIVATKSGEQAVEFDVSNAANQAVTAWSVDVEVGTNENVTKRWSLEREGYAAFAGLNTQEGHVIPSHAVVHGRIAVGHSLDDVVVSALRARVRWVVFADCTWQGDAAGAQELFRERERDYEALTVILDALRPTGQSAGRERASVALSRLDSKDQPDYDHPMKRVMRRNLQMVVEGNPGLKGGPEDLLRDFVLRTEQLRQAADEHRRAK